MCLKKFLIIVITFVVFLSCFTMNVKASEPSIEDNLDKYNNVLNTCIYYDDLTKEDELKSVVKYYDMLSDVMKKFLYVYNINIYLIDENARGLVEKEDTDLKIGATSYGPTCTYKSDENYKYVRLEKLPRIEYYSNNAECHPEIILHEVGHELDWVAVPTYGYYTGTLNGISDSKIWLSLYEENKEELSKIDKLAEENVKIDNREGFAEAVRLYFQKGDKLKESCYKVYCYIDLVTNHYQTYVLRQGQIGYAYNFYKRGFVNVTKVEIEDKE